MEERPPWSLKADDEALTLTHWNLEADAEALA
jgi:hypothetical protein